MLSYASPAVIGLDVTAVTLLKKTLVCSRSTACHPLERLLKGLAIARYWTNWFLFATRRRCSSCHCEAATVCKLAGFCEGQTCRIYRKTGISLSPNALLY